MRPANGCDTEDCHSSAAAVLLRNIAPLANSAVPARRSALRMGNAIGRLRLGRVPTLCDRSKARFLKGEISMRKLFALLAIVGLGVSIIGCGDAKKADKKPAETPAAPAPDATK